MAKFTLIPRIDEQPAAPLTIDSPDASAAVHQAKCRLRRVVDGPAPPQQASIDVGELAGLTVRWLGSWHWRAEDDQWAWSAA